MNNSIRFILVYVLFAVAGLIITTHRDAAVPTNKPFSQFPLQVNSWHMSKQNEFSDSILNVLKPTDYLSRQYTGANRKTVSLYLGYHGGGKNGGEIHSPKHCLPGSGWYEVSTQRGELATGNGTINLVRALYQKGDSKELFLYWFQVRDQSISNEYSLKIAQIINSALHKRRDATFVRVSVPVATDINQANSDGEQFIRDFSPHFKEFLPR
jgi:EpsI family protein